jgi:hypothetical protein
MFCKRFDSDVTQVSHMLQDYIPMVSAQSYVVVSVFMLQVVNILSGYCICLTRVSSVGSKCYICFKRMLHSSVSCFIGVFKDHGGTARTPGGLAWQARCERSGHVARLAPVDRSMLILIPALGSRPRGERRGSLGRSHGHNKYGCVCVRARGAKRGEQGQVARVFGHPYTSHAVSFFYSILILDILSYALCLFGQQMFRICSFTSYY